MLQKVSIQEFRNNFAKYLNTTSPIVIVRQRKTVGYFLPTHQEPEKAELEALKSAAAKLDTLLQEKGISEDELVSEFRQLRQQN
ncbi:MAG: type II toxin-antitoxin system Phd/YefM family antitoxin [Xenococcus sp. (in: cyanobacteria)]